MDLLTQPLVWLLHELYNVTGNLGLSIIFLTLAIRGALLPLTLPALKSQKKIRALQPKLKELKDKHGEDKMALAQAQQALYKEHQVNPLGGCLPYLLQFVVLIALYHVLRQFIGEGANGLIENVTFLGVDLTQRDSTYIIPLLAAGTQFVMSLMIAPGAETRNLIPDSSSSAKVKKANEKEEDLADMAEMMQKQMMFVMPVMTGVFAASFPAGLGVYWVTTTLFSVVQQYFISGLGGLTHYLPGQKNTDFAQETRDVLAVETETPSPTQSVKKKSKNTDKSVKKSSKKGENAFAAAFKQSVESEEPGSTTPVSKPQASRTTKSATKKKSAKKTGKNKRAKRK